MGMLANRLRRMYRHLRKWARRTEVSCFRLYEKDIPEHPLIVDWYDGRALAYAMHRKRDETPEARALLPRFLSDFDPSIRFAAIQWIGEHRLEVYRGQLLSGLTSGSATRELFEATLAALDQLDGPRRNPKEELAGEDPRDGGRGLGGQDLLLVDILKCAETV